MNPAGSNIQTGRNLTAFPAPRRRDVVISPTAKIGDDNGGKASVFAVTRERTENKTINEDQATIRSSYDTGSSFFNSRNKNQNSKDPAAIK